MRRTATFAFVFALFGSLAAPSADAQVLRSLGLNGIHVNRLAVHEGYLYACTDNGLYRRPVASTGTQWGLPALMGRSILDVAGISPTTLLAAKKLTSDPGDTVSLFRGSNLEPIDLSLWEPFQNGFGAGGGTSERQARRLLPLSGIPGTILATSSRVEKSTDNGTSWRVVGQPGAVINAIEQSPLSSGLIWVGGETNILWPYVRRSSDAGETWQEFSPFAGGDNAVDAIAPHPTDSSEVYLGMEGRVMWSQDDGSTWSTLTAPDPTIYTFGMVARPFPPLKLYAAGASFAFLPSVTLYTSRTGGLSWESFSRPALGGDNDVYHLLVLAASGSVTVLLATGNGVFSFSETPTAVPVSEGGGEVALRGGPNPFHGNTELEFALASPEAVTLRIVDIRGRVVSSLIDSALGSGPHRAAWSAGDLPAGIYFAWLRTGSREESLKLLHFR